MGRVVSEKYQKHPISKWAGIDKNTQPSPGYRFENIDMFEGSADLIIDFPAGSIHAGPYAERTKTALMVATTGLGKSIRNCWSRRQNERFSIPPICRWALTWSRTSAAG